MILVTPRVPQAVIADSAIRRVFVPEIIGEIPAAAFDGETKIADHRPDAHRILFLSFPVFYRVYIKLFGRNAVTEKIKLRGFF